MLRAHAEFPAYVGGPTSDFKQAEICSMSDFIYPVLLDTDPTQLVDDEFKNRHN